MITLNKKLKKDSSEMTTSESPPPSAISATSNNERLRLFNSNLNNNNNNNNSNIKRISIRDRLLVKDVQEMEQNLPTSCKIHFSDPNILSEFSLLISPEEGFWKDGKFKFNIYVPEEYNMQPPLVRCDTKLWHPNISVDGEICLSLLRTNSIDGLGWAPTRRLKDVIWGLNSLFTDLLNFDDPLNSDASDEYSADKKRFILKVREYIQLYARR